MESFGLGGARGGGRWEPLKGGSGGGAPAALTSPRGSAGSRPAPGECRGRGGGSACPSVTPREVGPAIRVPSAAALGAVSACPAAPAAPRWIGDFAVPPPLPPAYPVLPSLPPPPRGGVPGSGSVPSFRAVSQREGVAFPPIPAAGTMAEPFVVESPDVAYSKDFIEAQYTYSTAHVCREGGVTKVGGAGTPTDGTAAPPRWVPTSRPPPRAAGPALLHALHFPHGAARPPPGADAGGLGGQQRHHGDGGRVGQPPGAVLDDQDRAQGGCGGRGRPCRVPSFSGGGLGGCWALWRSLTLAFCPPPLESQLLRLAAAGLHCMPGCRPHRRRLRAIPGPAAHGAPQRHRL